MSQNNNLTNVEPEENHNEPNVTSDLQNSVASEGNQAVHIEGHVISGSTLNQANFHGPVTGPVHTGSGNIYINPPPSVPATAQILTNVWYLEKEYRWWQYRNPDVGTLELKSEQVHFHGRKYAVQMAKIQSITHGHQPGDLNNNWVKVSYLDEKGGARLAFFADAKKLGIGNLVGGSDAIFQALRAWQAATEEER